MRHIYFPFRTLFSSIALMLLPAVAGAVERFPRPEFDNNHVIPAPSVPPPPPSWVYIFDISLLFLALVAAAYFALKGRSRKGMTGVMLFSLAYFGFFKHGCVCSVGSLQNVVFALAEPSYHLSWVIFAVFALPLVFSLFFGRVFCGGVCPLGAIQDIVILKPLKVPRRLDEALGLLPYIYLGFAVLLAATGSMFLICRYDPFVGFFRLSSSVTMTAAGAAVLLLGVFIARPYCRYLCPYGVLLRITSYFSRFRLKITQDECISCRLCENSCPFGAVRKPADTPPPEPRKQGIRRLLLYFVVFPFIVAVCGFAGRTAAPYISGLNPVVARAEYLRNSRNTVSTGEFKFINRAALKIEEDFKEWSLLLGLFTGIVIGAKLIALSIYPSGKIFHPDKMKCLSCTRCIPSCPLNRK